MIVVYSKAGGSCRYCHYSVALLEKAGVEYEVRDVDSDDLRTSLREKTGGTTFPFVFVNGAYIGGFRELSSCIGALTISGAAEAAF